MGERSIVYDSDGKPIHVRETSDDGRSSVLYEYDDSLVANVFGDHRGKAVEWADHHENGKTDAYEYDDSLIANVFNDHRGEKKNEDKGGCFLTTACVEHAGLPDNCHELEVLRRFRPAGREVPGDSWLDC